MRQRFVTGVGGTLRFVPCQAVRFGPPTTPTVTIKTARGLDLPTPVVGVPATVDPVSTTVSNDAGEGDLALVLGSVTGIKAGRCYLVTTPGGDRLLVEVAAVQVSTKTVAVYEHLRAAVPAQSTFQGVELSHELAGAQCPDPISYAAGIGVFTPPLVTARGTTTPLYRVAWSFSVDGVAYTGDQLYEVRRRILYSTLIADEVERHLPAAWTELSDEGPRALERAIDGAWDDVLDALAEHGFDPDKVMDADRLRKPHRLRVLANLAPTWGPDWKEWAAEKVTEYREAIEKALASGDWYDVVEDSVQGANEVKWPQIQLVR